MIDAVLKTLKDNADSKRAAIHQRFFKTGPGEYGEGDVFLGIRVPVMRKIAHTYKDMALGDVGQMMKSGVHEERFVALLILIHKFKRGTWEIKKQVFELYVQNMSHVNNWDLVDVSAEHIIGAYLVDTDKSWLRTLARSQDLWKRRIAMIATFHYIKKNQFDDALKVAEILVNDTEDLIHKAVGWMLREIGKRNQDVEEAFLKPRVTQMPRTMLRYAIERFPEAKRLRYLKGTV